MKLIAIFLTSASLLTSCGEVPENDEETDNESSSALTEETAELENQRLYNDTLPDNLNADGKTIRFLSGEIPGSTFHSVMTGSEDSEGELINDCIHEANLAIMDRFNISVEEERQSFDGVTTSARKIVNSGDDAYDIISGIDRDVYSMAAENMIIPLDTLIYVDLSQPWWNESINESLTIGGRLWAGYSDAMLTSYDFTHILLFNKGMISMYNLDNPYDYVMEGTWTFDKFTTMAETVASDINGDQIWDENDRYGWLAVPKHIAPTIWIASGTQSITKDENGIPVYSMNTDTRIVDAMQLAYDMSWGNTFWYQTSVRDAADVQNPAIFSQNNALFSSTAFYSLFSGYYREMEFDYGIIPYPKFDEAQDKYYTRIEGGNISFVPITCKDADFAGAMLEAYACEFKNTVIPAYYETSLKVKYSRDDASSQIIDMMMENRIYDLGDTLFCNQLRDGFVASAFNSKKVLSVSMLQKAEKVMTTAITSLVEQLID